MTEGPAGAAGSLPRGDGGHHQQQLDETEAQPLSPVERSSRGHSVVYGLLTLYL